MIPFTGIFKKKDKDRYMLVYFTTVHCGGRRGGS